MAGKDSTAPGYINRNCQINLGPTDPRRSGSDLNSYVYVMHCVKCGVNYGANALTSIIGNVLIASGVRPDYPWKAMKEIGGLILCRIALQISSAGKMNIRRNRRR